MIQIAGRRTICLQVTGFLPPLVAFCVILMTLGCDRSNSDVTPVSTGVVTIVVGDAMGDSISIPDVADGATVEEVMRDMDPALLPVTINGSGLTAFVESLAGKSTADGKGWLFKIDGQASSVGIGSATLHPPTIVEWQYGEFDSMMPGSGEPE